MLRCAGSCCASGVHTRAQVIDSLDAKLNAIEMAVFSQSQLSNLSSVARALSLAARQVEVANTIIRVDSLVHVAEVKPAWAPD